MQKKFLQKNVKKCDKIESSLNIMFKKYKEKSAEQANQLAEMNVKKSNVDIEKSVIETLQMQESRNIVTRYHDLQVQLDRQQQKEKQL